MAVARKAGLWVSEDGMKMQGYNGSQGWDASFTMQVNSKLALGYDASV